MDLDELVEATDHEYNTMPEAVNAKLQEIEEGELEDGAFDKGDIAETICDRIASEEYGEEELGEETLEAFESLIGELSETL
ncbi:hypothetical protein [Halorussus amylolyticus]|uniref:hypothetical protein n=1 Tax=Halorussus amylolyticus TaxID=1126242 RepID=UPI00104F9671|nr:hypothetical protein [Halorussus amylolyticus]